ncbi:MAG TPA: SgcJ/EcaC family oxidoreductase [Edaphobacter sp.]|nr:SgcJ/EcaC family oxidoreductase [Edaphobacter sp.]
MQTICLALLAAPAGVSLAQDAASEGQIRAIVADQVVAWNAGDGHAYARQLAPDASFTNLFGMVMCGAPAFAKRHSEILNTFYRSTTKSHVIRRLRFVTSDIAIVDIDNEVRGAGWHRRAARWHSEDAFDGSLRTARGSMVDRGVSQRGRQVCEVTRTLIDTRDCLSQPAIVTDEQRR